MLDNRLYLVSVVKFLRRSRVDHGTRGSRVVVGTDLSKRKVYESVIVDAEGSMKWRRQRKWR